MKPKSIDINALISKEAHTTPSHQPELPTKIENPFLAILDGERQGLLSTDIDLSSPSLQFCLNVTRETCRFIEKKDSKSRHFHFLFPKQFLKVGERRAYADDFIKLKNRLRLLAVCILNNHPTIFIKQKNTEASSDNPVLAYLETSQNISEATRYQSIKTASLSLLNSLASYITAFSQRLSPKPQASKTNPLLPKLYHLKDQFLDILGTTHTETRITNATLVNPRLNTVYNLVINPTKLTLTEKNAITKNHIIFDMMAMKITLNGQPVSNTSLNWFVYKAFQIGADLDAGKAEMFNNT